MDQITHTSDIDWIPLGGGTSFKPITFHPDGSGYQLLLRVEPGTVIAPHHHTDVHTAPARYLDWCRERSVAS